jgi:protein SCO1/2
MLCNLVLNGLTQSLEELDWTAGKEFNVVTVSIHPNEGPELAAAKRQAQLAAYGRDVQGGWPFLSDLSGNARRLADQVGWMYRWDERQKQFAHAAAIVLLTPDGRIARYLYGVRHKPRDLRLALTEASAGRLGGVGEKLMMFCYQYDPNSQSYVLFARRFMSLGGAVVLSSLIAMLFVFWRRERRRISETLAVG